MRLLNAQDTLSADEKVQAARFSDAFTLYTEMVKSGLASTTFPVWVNSGGYPDYSTSVEAVNAANADVQKDLAAISGAEAPLWSQDLINCQTANNASIPTATPG